MRQKTPWAARKALSIAANPDVDRENRKQDPPSFGALLSEAEAVHDHVRLSLAARRGTVAARPELQGSPGGLRQAWLHLCQRWPWAGGAPLHRPFMRR